MPYDFTTLVNRRDAGSIKWDAMLGQDPDLPADIVPLSVGDMELKNPPELVAGLKDYLDTSVLGYTHPTADYHKALAAWFAARHGWSVDADSVVPMDGVVPAIFAAVHAFSEPGDGVVVMPPVYYPFFRAARVGGRRPVEVPLILDGDTYRIDYAGLETAFRGLRNKLLLLCSPHNPVARVWSRDELERLGRLCLAHGVLVISDEIHMDFAMPGHRHQAYAALGPEFAANCLVCTAPSKTFNIAGLQIANIVIPDATLRKRFRDEYEASGRHGPGQLSLAACRLVYERCGPWLDELLVLLANNAALIRSFADSRLRGVRVLPHEGTFFVWLDFRAWGLDAPALERFMTRDALLYLDEGHIFGSGGAGFERFNIACPTHTLAAALDRLAAACDRAR